MKGMAYHGWKDGLPQKFWPVTLDNFFDDPDEIRKLGLHMLESDKHSSEEGAWPGFRSQMLGSSIMSWRMDKDLTKKICDKILSCYFNLKFEQIFWNECEIQFQLIPSIDKDKNNIKNKGWIHRDGVDPRWPHAAKDVHGSDPELAGVIYLTPDIDPGTGTSLFNMKKDKTLEDSDKAAAAKLPVYKGNSVNVKELEEQWEKHASCFVEKVRFENIYNRLIMYDTKEWHAVNSYYIPEDKDDRLTMVFFIGKILAKDWPLQRVREIKC